MSPEGEARPASGQQARFGVFEFDLGSLELTRNGHHVRLQQQPAMLLALLLHRAGGLVLREELRGAIWPSGTYVEFDLALNTAVSRLRRVLRDSATEPRYIETVPKSGYRFIAPVELVAPPPLPAPSGPVPDTERVRDLPPKQSVPVQRWKLLLSALAGVVALAAVSWSFIRAGGGAGGTVRDARAIHYSLTLPPEHHVEVVAISPKGDQIIYQATVAGSGRSLYRRYLDDEESRRISGSEEGTQPFFSPDGNTVGFYTPGTLRLVDAEGSRDRISVSREFALRKACWGTDGYIYYTTEEKGIAGLFRASPRGGPPEPILTSKATGKGSVFYFGQQILAGAPALLFSWETGPLRRSISWHDLREGSDHTLVERGMGGQVLPTGHLVYYWRGKLLAAPFDAEARKISGAPAEVVARVSSNGWRGPNAGISNNGTLVYLESKQPQRKLVWVHPNGNESDLPIPPAVYEQAEVSPDGTRIAIARQDAPDLWTLWIYEMRTGAWTRLLEIDVPRPRALWSPDSKALIVSATQGEAEYVNLYRISPQQPQKLERLTEEAGLGQFPHSWSAPANAVLFTQGVLPSTAADISVLPLSGNQRPRLLISSPGIDSSPSFSPDGRWFAYASGDESHREVFVQPYSQATPSKQVSSGGGQDPLWSPDGKQLYFLGAGRCLMTAPVGADGAIGPPRQLLPANFTLPTDWWTRGYSLAPDGRFLVLRNVGDDSAVSRVRVVVNWFDELSRLAPLR